MGEQLEKFFALFLEAIAKIEGEYFYTTYDNIGFQDDIRRLSNARLIRYEDGIVYRPGERVFSYELYYQLRVLIEETRKEFPNFLSGCFLQSEVKKHQISTILRAMDVAPLSRNYIPDMLMHTPGTDDLNAYVIEIKATYQLTADCFIYDLQKLGEFIIKYHYHRGIFLAICISMAQIQDLINSVEIRQSLRAIFNEADAAKVTIVTRERHYSETQQTELITLLY